MFQRKLSPRSPRYLLAATAILFSATSIFFTVLPAYPALYAVVASNAAVLMTALALVTERREAISDARDSAQRIDMATAVVLGRMIRASAPANRWAYARMLEELDAVREYDWIDGRINRLAETVLSSAK